MRNLHRIMNVVQIGKWMIQPTVLHNMAKQLNAAINGDLPIDTGDDVDDSEPQAMQILPSKTAIISIDGIIGKHLGLMETMCGGVDLDNINTQLDAVANNPEIERLIIYFNTAGGTVTGVPETAAKIAALSDKIEVIGYCDVLCASAGYYLASQCGAFFCAASSDVGSINVYCLLIDESQALINEGIKVNAIVGSNGKFKLAGASFKPLSDDEKAMFQADINNIQQEFYNAVLSKRTVSIEDMQGQCFSGVDSVTKGLADGNCASLDELISFLEN